MPVCQFELWLTLLVEFSKESYRKMTIADFTSSLDGHIWNNYSKTVVKFRNKFILLVKSNFLTDNFQAAGSYLKYKITNYIFLMHDSVATFETIFFLKWFNFENCFSKLMTAFVESCFYYLLFLALILSLVCNKNKQPLIAFCEKMCSWK